MKTVVSIFLSIILYSSFAFADLPVLVKDINTLPDGYVCYNSIPTRLNNSDNSTGGVIFFSCSTPEFGEELWKSDGTPLGTKMVTDAIPGPDSLVITTIIPIIGSPTPKVFFLGSDNEHGTELWFSDGTPSGTKLIQDLNPGPTSTSFFSLTAFGSQGITFFASTPDIGFEPRYSNGSTISLLADINPGVGSSASTEMVFIPSLGKTIFPATNPTFGSELWITDTTASSVSLVKDIRAGTGGSSPANMVLNQSGNGVYFRATEPTTGTELWKSDGTAVGTVLVKDIVPGGSSNPQFLTTGPGGVLFFGGTSTTGDEYYFSDGTAAGTLFLGDLNPGADSSVITTVSPLSTTDKFYFIAYTPTTGIELFSYSPGAGTPALVSDFTPGTQGTIFSNTWMRAIGNKLFISVFGGPNDGELLTTNGSSLQLVRDINPGEGSSYASPLGNLSSTIVFRALSSKREIWRTDGSFGGTFAIKDMSIPGRTSSSSPQFGGFVGDSLLFAASGDTTGIEPHISDGTTNGTKLIADIASGSLGSINSFLIFPSLNKGFGQMSSGLAGNEPGVVTTSSSTTGIIADIANTISRRHSSPTMFTLYRGKVYFLASDTNGALQLFATDGTLGNVSQITGVGPALNITPASTQDLIVFNDKLFFPGRDLTSLAGIELYSSDGTSAGTTLFADLNSGSGSSNPTRFFVDGNKMYFKATVSSTLGGELLITDGTLSGTTLLADIEPGPGSGDPTVFAKAQNTIFFSASAASLGSELWKTDGTISGTQFVKDIYPGLLSGLSSSNVQRVITLGNKVIFPAINENGDEPWVSDGTPSGTFQLGDLNPGALGSTPTGFTKVDNKVIFSSFQQGIGREFFETDGSAAGTRLIFDFNPGPNSGASGFVYKDGTVYGSMNNGLTGFELYKWVVDKCPNDPNKQELGACGCGVSDSDDDGDGISNCNDQCPQNPSKTTPGICGCDGSDSDLNGNTQADCLDPTLFTVPSDPSVKVNKKTGEITITASVLSKVTYKFTFRSIKKVLVKGKKKYLSTTVKSNSAVLKLNKKKAKAIADKIKSKVAVVTVNLVAGTTTSASSVGKSKVTLVK